jgi:hypothetical protein
MVAKSIFILVLLASVNQITAQTAPTPGQHDQPSALEFQKFRLEEKKLVWIIVGGAVAMVSVLIGGLGLATSLHKDRRLRHQEYANQIRKSAGTTIAKLERWNAVSDSLFFQIQADITDADIMFLKSSDAVGTRDQLWRRLLDKLTARSQALLDEGIELAYIDLYGYDPSIRDLFRETVRRLRLVNDEVDDLILQSTQADVLSFRGMNPNAVHSALLGNKLRATTQGLSAYSKEATDAIVAPFQQELARLIDASDSEIFSKSVRLRDPSIVFQRLTLKTKSSSASI